MKTQLGIPYARVDFDAETGEPLQICPVCGKECPMTMDAVGEAVVSTYANHYEREHEEES